MASIKVQTAYHYISGKMVLIDGEIAGNIKKGDTLFNIDNQSEMYQVKGIALMKLKNGVGNGTKIQLEPGNYDAEQLIGKMLIAR